ncbi:MAG: DUF3016 domain-containing protein [Rubrivivax sp.]|nr:DUF3016 domain-containing protein [Rubrivivax sp.]
MSTAPWGLVRLAAAAALAISMLPATAAGTVEVSWLQPERYSDAGRSIVDRERTMTSLGEYLGQLGRQLPDGQTLKIEVLDVNLAGEVEPHGWDEVRILRGRADWPQMTVRYTLQAGGQTLKAGEAHLSDLNYFAFQRGLRMGHGDLAYEKRMVDRWFSDHFAGH